MSQPSTANENGPPSKWWQRAGESICFWHAVVAGVWLWMMPGGFPWFHPRFWSNRAGPVLCVAIGLAGFAALRRERWSKGLLLLSIWPALWTGALIGGVALFPVSARVFGLPLAIMCALLWLAFIRVGLRQTASQRALASAMIVTAAIGVSLPLTQRAPEPSAAPLDMDFSPVGGQRVPPADSTPRQLGKGLFVDSTGAVHATLAGLQITVEPLLTFSSISPDRCWTIFAPGRGVVRTRRILREQFASSDEIWLGLADDQQHQLWVARENDERFRIESDTKLDEPVYSHLNSFSELLIHGHRELAIVFSVCPEAIIPVEPFDYPVGRPARFAYWSADNTFHIVQASSGEKGPFQELARAPLSRNQELVITLLDQGKPVAAIAFADWATQAGTELSPTAGWGVPVNAIEWMRLGEEPSAPVAIWLTLAGTSVGRGWDSVGHQHGIYRNRMRIESRL